MSRLKTLLHNLSGMVVSPLLVWLTYSSRTETLTRDKAAKLLSPSQFVSNPKPSRSYHAIWFYIFVPDKLTFSDTPHNFILSLVLILTHALTFALTICSAILAVWLLVNAVMMFPVTMVFISGMLLLVYLLRRHTMKKIKQRKTDDD